MEFGVPARLMVAVLPVMEFGVPAPLMVAVLPESILALVIFHNQTTYYCVRCAWWAMEFGVPAPLMVAGAT